MARARAYLRGAKAAGTLAVLLAACQSGGEQALPTESDLEGWYGPGAQLTLNGNVVDVRADQPLSQVLQGGDLWARVGPYIYLFSPQTREIFQRWDGVAAVRVVTSARGGRVRIAEALLTRDALGSIGWRQARRRVARARLEGTRNPGYLEALVRFGEDHASYEYNPRFVSH